MNIQEKDILMKIKEESFLTQRMLAESTGLSLGKINGALAELKQRGYLTPEMRLTEKAEQEFQDNAPCNAIILAAGYGMRMVPINRDVPKGLLEVHGETLIERQIGQLKEAGIQDISVVVGYMKEFYEYLIDAHGVELVINPEYGSRNNLHSMQLVSERIGNTYILPCDIWCGENPFRRTELYSWYMVTNREDTWSEVRVNRKRELVKASGGNQMIGIAYIAGDISCKVRERIRACDINPEYRKCFWEEVLFENHRMLPAAREEKWENICEINTYEQLRELDAESRHLHTEVMQLIVDVLGAEVMEIQNIAVLKKGMTNRSFLFSCKNKKYIMRIPGEGTEKLIDRKREYEVYTTINGRGICDEICYINPHNGYKMTRYIENARTCDALNDSDVGKCMRYLRRFHERRLQVDHEFDVFGQIEYYESLWSGAGSCYRDYEQTKRGIYELKDYIEGQPKEWGLSHIDAVPDNFLFYQDPAGEEKICLIDWEYAGMQDVHIDIAMFAIYAMYSRTQIETLIDLYFEESCSREVRRKIYSYIAVCGLLWSNWCEYKRQLGVEFGEYSLRQYRYAKEYYRIWKEEGE